MSNEMPYWESDDIDCTSWEVAMKVALKRFAFTGAKQYVWAYHGRKNRIGYVATPEPQKEPFK